MLKVRILIIEDYEDDAIIISNALHDNGFEVEYEIVDNESSFRKAVKSGSWDMIIDDFNVPGFDGSHALETYHGLGLDIPFIAMSGSISDEEAVAILKSGAHDYINKNNLLRLPHAVKKEIKEALLRKKQRENELKIIENEKRLKIALGEAIGTISEIVEMKDPYTAGHQKRVASLVVKIAQKFHFNSEEIETLRLASIIHDLGKIAIPASILNKPGKLNQIEMDLIKTHPLYGYEILKNNASMQKISHIILQHHEKMDGSGYPKGLKDQEIDLSAKIITVSDVVEAMVSHRPYRPALGIETALGQIEENKGKLYDEKVVFVCLRIFKEENFSF